MFLGMHHGPRHEHKLEKFTTTVHWDDPNSNFYIFAGKMDPGDEDDIISSHSLSASQLILGYSNLQNMDYRTRQKNVPLDTHRHQKNCGTSNCSMVETIDIEDSPVLEDPSFYTLVKFIQVVLVNNNFELFDELNGNSIEARTSNLNQNCDI
ncbi:hypothetical protein LXL04_025341 [Taraxacum kok-saghyz]